MIHAKLLAEYPAGLDDEQIEGLAGLDGLVIGADALEDPRPAIADGGLILRGLDPEEQGAWREQEGVRWVCEGGLEETAKLQDAWPDLDWVPRGVVSRPNAGYRFYKDFDEVAFTTYKPDPAALMAHWVADGDTEIRTWARRAAELGFACLWLHSELAIEAGRGLDLDGLEKVRSRYAGDVWLSGGVLEMRHINTLASDGGCAALVLPASQVVKFGVSPIRTALGRDESEQTVASSDEDVDAETDDAIDQTA